MINCIDCDVILNTRNKNTLRCIKCYLNHIKVKDQFCIDCGKQLNKYRKAIRCYSCNNNYQWKNNGRFLPESPFINILTKEFLYQKYIVEKMTAKNIAKIINCDKTCIYSHLKKKKIPIRNNSESHLGQEMSSELRQKFSRMFSGSGNPNWKNGMGNFPYNMDFSNQLKLEIRKRDGFKCQYCGLKEEDHFRGNKQINLIIHHMDYNKENCNQSNLITVCNKDNIIANFNRDYWFAYYTYIMENYIKENKKWL